MKKAKGEDGSDTTDRISGLPKDILLRILYFLPQEEAVRTSVLSKSWRYNWCARPNLDLSYDTFKGNKHEFKSTVNNSLQRYCDQRLSLEEFQLFISRDDYSDSETVRLLEKWIPLLTIMGLKKFRLSAVPEYTRLLPPVVFGAESLEDLHLRGFMLDQKAIERIVIFKHLRSLRLERVCIEEEILQKVISCCPLIETLCFIGYVGRLRTVKVDDLHNLKSFSFFPMYDFTEELCSIELYAPSLETVNISKGNIWFHEGADFRNLKHLNLQGMKSSMNRLSSCKFPSLEFLKISYCSGLKKIHLSVAAPNILKFVYEGDFVPSISFATNSRDWKSDIYVPHSNDTPSSTWLLKLSELLKSLPQSIISLCVSQFYRGLIDDENITVRDNGYDKLIVLECLNLNCHSSCLSSLLVGMFGICRPRNIGSLQDIESAGFLWKILMERENGDRKDKLRQLLFRDLEEVSFEVTETNREEWHPVTFPEYLRNYLYLDYRFALTWRETV